ncbi:MAG: hypothetical protein ACRDIY_08890 [Chloroflexota bacterium]
MKTAIQTTPGGRAAKPARGTGRHVRLVADLGLTLLPALAIETLTGAVLFLFAHGLTPRGSGWATATFNFLAANNLLVLQDISFQTDVHVWAGYLTTWALVLKAWNSWPTLTGWWPRRFSRSRLATEKAAAWALLVLAPASYLSGIAVALRWLPLQDRLALNVHLWVSVALLAPLGWHIWRYFPEGLRVLTVQIRHAAHLRRLPILSRM